MAVNHLVFQGRFVEDPSCGQTNSGTDYANFRLAWNEKYKDRETKCFVECKAFGGTAKFIGQYFSRGQEIIVEGKMNTEEWEKDGQKRSKLVLMVNNAHFSSKKADGASAGNDSAPVPTPVETDGLPF